MELALEKRSEEERRLAEELEIQRQREENLRRMQEIQVKEELIEMAGSVLAQSKRAGRDRVTYSTEGTNLPLSAAKRSVVSRSWCEPTRFGVNWSRPRFPCWTHGPATR